jgi:hypothetical protein
VTLRNNARLAGVTFLVYIAAGMTSMSRQFVPAVDIELTFVQVFCALVLAVTLYAITRSVDEDVALLALTCRVGEGVVGAAALAGKFSGFGVGATLFAAGSTLFCWLLLRGRLIPVALAWLGLLASVLTLAYVPLQLANVLPSVFYIWLPMLVFEITFALWLIGKGVNRVSPSLRS